MTNREQFQKQHPESYYLDLLDLVGLTGYMQERGWLENEEALRSVSKAGDGNMNFTLRVRSSMRSLILKQARPWVEKYPHIAAPRERVLVEGRFYDAVSADPQLAALMPKMLGLDATSHILALEDLGEAKDFTTIYCSAAQLDTQLDELPVYLSLLHRLPVSAASRRHFSNHEMRALNHLHIFDFPLRADNGLNLDSITSGLQSAMGIFKDDSRYGDAVRDLGKLYLRDDEVLLHGDFFPGSWLQTAGGLRVIDPEFCFLGPPEFDLGVMVAHLQLAKQDTAIGESLLTSYQAPRPLKSDLVRQFAGVEIMRRLIGVAQLPVCLDLREKTELLELSRRLVLHPEQGVSQ